MIPFSPLPLCHPSIDVHDIWNLIIFVIFQIIIYSKIKLSIITRGRFSDFIYCGSSFFCHKSETRKYNQTSKQGCKSIRNYTYSNFTVTNQYVRISHKKGVSLVLEMIRTCGIKASSRDTVLLLLSCSCLHP